MALLERRRPVERGVPQARALTGSATPVNLADRNEGKRLQNYRKSWQLEALAYRSSVPELRYASSYLGNIASRCRVHAAVYQPGENEPTELTLANAAELGIPDDLAQAAQDAINRLASGSPLAVASILRKMTEHFEISGEGYLLGVTDETTGVESWSFRSVTEIDVAGGNNIKVREIPNARKGDGLLELDPATTALVRVWWPDTQWSGLADSPVRACLDILEELLLTGRDVRATARSRIANNGILFVPDSLSIVPLNANELDPRQDPFLSELMATIAATMQNEGAASSVAPILIRGPAEAGQMIKHILFDRPQNRQNIAQRQELITRLATGLDLPSEVLTGKGDINHWGLWQIADDTFRAHVEPIMTVEVDALTAGFLWTQLDAFNAWDPAIIRRIMVWFDPTAVLTHPDRSQDAFTAWDKMAISDEALRKYLGFPDTDAPSNKELLLRMATHLRSLDPAVQVQILKRLDPTLEVPAVSAAPLPVGQEPPAIEGPADGPPPGGPPEATAQRRADMNDVWRRYYAAVREVGVAEPAVVETAQDIVDTMLDSMTVRDGG